MSVVVLIIIIMQLHSVTSWDIINCLTIPLCKLVLSFLFSLLFSFFSSTPNSLQMLPSCSSAQPHILWCSRQVTYCNKSLVINCCKHLSLFTYSLPVFYYCYSLSLLHQLLPPPCITLARLDWLEVTILQKEDLRYT